MYEASFSNLASCAAGAFSTVLVSSLFSAVAGFPDVALGAGVLAPKPSPSVFGAAAFLAVVDEGVAFDAAVDLDVGFAAATLGLVVAVLPVAFVTGAFSGVLAAFAVAGLAADVAGFAAGLVAVAVFAAGFEAAAVDLTAGLAVVELAVFAVLVAGFAALAVVAGFAAAVLFAAGFAAVVVAFGAAGFLAAVAGFATDLVAGLAAVDVSFLSSTAGVDGLLAFVGSAIFFNNLRFSDPMV
ncbi:hypothetical protein [Sphingobacterium hotanense]|uniref:hypothetical protein n=1 Tax=Sphingobacterium hotanense TaxID=649196 RepID=UPI0021A2D813|nr:hypothetical protein [Sphingobacterium hotanense]MCT1525499.1 hypothetical protein [Sphingobacterium hotanense]